LNRPLHTTNSRREHHCPRLVAITEQEASSSDRSITCLCFRRSVHGQTNATRKPSHSLPLLTPRLDQTRISRNVYCILTTMDKI